MTGFFLATLNACLNSLAFIFMILGMRAINARNIELHKKMMLGAFTSSALFLVSYLTRIFMFGDTKFQGTGAIRTAYFALLISHVVLAVVVAPGVIYSLIKGLRDERQAHKRVASKVLPVWAYVSVTGVLVYLALYHYG